MTCIYNKEELQKVQKESLERLINHAGSINHLAVMLGIKSNIVHGWSSRGRISKNGCRLVKNHPTLSEQFNINDLRPDL